MTFAYSNTSEPALSYHPGRYMVGTAEVLRASLRDVLGTVDFVPTITKLNSPPRGLVPRTRLLEHVHARRGDVVTVTAPAGYGKSTLLAELAAEDPRPTAWVSLTPAENDPAAFLTYVALALDDIEPVEPFYVADLWTQPPTIGSPVLQRFGAMLAARSRAFTLVLDDVHLLDRRDVLDTLPALITDLPTGSRILLGARTAIPLPLGRLRVKRRLVEVDPTQLAFDTDDTALLLRQLDVDATPEQVADLVQRTEGWPAAIYLAALSDGTRRGSMTDVVGQFGGDHRHLVEYLSEELLNDADDHVASFLLEAATLERMSGSLCDDVLERDGSAELLEDLRRRNLLVIPLDSRREWYRFHHLLSEFLDTELMRRSPRRRAAILLRAGEWFDAAGDGDGAVAHTVRSGDMTRAEAMVLRWYSSVSTAARVTPSTRRWMALFSSEQLAGRPKLMILAALSNYTHEPAVANAWLERAAASLPERHPEDAGGLATPVMLALARSLIAPITTAEVAADAGYAYERVGRGDGHPLACLMCGVAAFMAGDEAQAVALLGEGAGSRADRPLTVAVCLAYLALIDIENGRWHEATTAARKARSLIGEAASEPSMALVVAVSALVETHAGRGDHVEGDRKLCREHLTRLVDVAPWLNLEVRVVLARLAILRGHRSEASALLDEADAILGIATGAVRVADQVATIRREIASRELTQTFGPSSLTTAELRVLRLLPTHLSVAEIAERLYVSRNTVKSQTVSIYRKLGTSSRSGAVRIAMTAGLLHEGATAE